MWTKISLRIMSCLWALVLGGFSFGSVSAFAALAPTGIMHYSHQPYLAADALAACNIWKTATGVTKPIRATLAAVPDSFSSYNTLYRFAGASKTWNCEVNEYGDFWTWDISVHELQYCDIGATMTGTFPNAQCSVCPAGTIDQGGACVIPVPCPAAGTSAIPSGSIGYGESMSGTNPVLGVLCNENQCAIKIDSATAIPIGGNLQGNYITQATYTGERNTGTCPLIVTASSPADPSLPKPIDTVTPAADTPTGQPVSSKDCPPGSAFGSVNGVNVCAPSGSKIAYQPDTSTQTNNGTTTTSSTQRTDTVNSDGSVTTSKTTTSTGAGGATSTTTTTTNNTNNTFGGGSSKEGDSTGIDLGPAPSAESGDVPAIPGLAPGTGQDGAGQAERVFTVGSHFSGSAACIADRSVTALGITITVPLSQLCPWFDIMYKVVSLMAVFAALRILVMA